MAIYSDIAVKGTDNVKDADSLRQALVSLLQTQRGERIFLPNYGSNIDEFLYKTVDDWTAKDIEYSLRETLTSDYRMKIDTLTVTPDSDNNQYKVYVAVLFEGTGLVEETMNIKSKAI